MKILNKIFFSISIISLAITLYMLFSGNPEQTGPSTIFFLLFLALGINRTKKSHRECHQTRGDSFFSNPRPRYGNPRGGHSLYGK